MIRNYGVVREASQRLGEAYDRTVGDFLKGRVLQEPPLTDRLLTRISESIQGFRTGDVEWHGITLPDRGRNSKEKIYGADFVGVLRIELPDYQVTKGFLAQSKIRERIDLPELKEQCEKMLTLSPASFVFVFDRKEIRVVPAISVLSLRGDGKVDDLYSRHISTFFTEHFECFIGDRRISVQTDEVYQQLEGLRQEYRTRSGIAILADYEPLT